MIQGNLHKNVSLILLKYVSEWAYCVKYFVSDAFSKGLHQYIISFLD